MLRQEITILLIGLCSIGSFGGSPVVICYKVDGTVAIEPAILNNCICPDNIKDSTASEELDKYAIRSYGGCIDTPVVLTAMITGIKSKPDFPLLNLALDCLLKIRESNSSFCLSLFLQPSTFKAYFSPLRTIILLV